MEGLVSLARRLRGPARGSPPRRRSPRGSGRTGCVSIMHGLDDVGNCALEDCIYTLRVEPVGIEIEVRWGR